MRISHSTLPVCVSLVLCVCSGVLAQQPPAGNADPMTPLRAKDVISAQDEAVIQRWIADRVDALAQASKSNDGKALTTTRRNMVDMAGAGATPAFRVRYAELCVAAFQPYLSGGAEADPRVALYLSQVLCSLKQPVTVDAMLAGLSSKYPAVRLCAAKAIRDMRADIAASRAAQLDRIIQALQQAGAKEGDPPTARALYEAVDFRAQVPAQAGRVIAAMLTILEGRVQFYANNLVSDFYPDAYALSVLRNESNLGDAEKRRAIQVAAEIVEQAAARWAAVARPDETSPVPAENPYDVLSVRDWHLRYQLAYVTQEAEELLKRLGAVPAGQPVPNMADLMGDLSTAEQVQAAADRWQALVQPKAAASEPAGTPAAAGTP